MVSKLELERVERWGSLKAEEKVMQLGLLMVEWRARRAAEWKVLMMALMMVCQMVTMKD